MSISADSPLDETLNRDPLALLLRRQYEFPFGINIVQFLIFFFFIFNVFSRIETIDLVHYVVEKADTRKHPRTHRDFIKHYDKLREAAVFLYPRDIPHMDMCLTRAEAFDQVIYEVRSRLEEALHDHIGK